MERWTSLERAPGSGAAVLARSRSAAAERGPEGVPGGAGDLLGRQGGQGGEPFPDDAWWGSVGDALLPDRESLAREREESLAWQEIAEALQESMSAAAARRSPVERLHDGLGGLRGGIADVRLDREEVALLQEADLTGGLETLGEVALAVGAALFTFALEAHGRGLPGCSGFRLTDWLAVRCPWASRSELGDVDAVVRAAQRPQNEPLVAAVAEGRMPVRRGAVVARALRRLSDVLDPEGYDAFVTIFVDNACLPTISDADLHQIIETALRALLDDKERSRRERLAHEARSFRSRRLGEGLTRFIIDAPEEDAAVLHGIVTSALAAPASTEEGPDTRSATQRRYDAFRTVLGRGTACPEGTGTMPRATLMITMRLDDLVGRTRGCGTTSTGEVLSPGQVRRLACESEVIPVVLGGPSEILDVGRAHRLATPGQVKALRLRDGGCTFPGCTIPPEWCIAHHLVWWSRGGRTDMDTLALLCQRHHTTVHQKDLEGEVVGGCVVWHV